MKVDNINITETIAKAKASLKSDEGMSSDSKSNFDDLITVVTLLMNKLNLNSSNSSNPPSTDPFGKKKTKGYKLLLTTGLKGQTTIEEKKIYLETINGVIHYKCRGLDGEIAEGTITQAELPEEIHVPSSNKLYDFLAIKRFILDAIYKKGHIKKVKHPGGQPGHPGVTLNPVDDPDEIINISVEKSALPLGLNYREEGYLARQVVNIYISSKVIEYRAEIIVDDLGNKYMAEFPNDVTRSIQYGPSVKAKIVYLSVYQLIPYQRVQEHFEYEYNIPISTGTISNSISTASNKLITLGFDTFVKQQLIQARLAYADETSLNVNGVKIWLHGFSNEKWTWMEPHINRGLEAMKDIGILPFFKGILVHDHWKAYFHFLCQHVLCNSHHLRELTRAHEHDSQQWALAMYSFLQQLNKEVDASHNNVLSAEEIEIKQLEYREILAQGDNECPAIQPAEGKKRKPKQSKSRNLLERLKDFETSVLLFMMISFVPFTNNLGEREIRMNKVRQKISGCFKTMASARHFCRVRSYLATCKKHGISASDALNILFDNKLPDFMNVQTESKPSTINLNTVVLTKPTQKAPTMSLEQRGGNELQDKRQHNVIPSELTNMENIQTECEKHIEQQQILSISNIMDLIESTPSATIGKIDSG